MLSVATVAALSSCSRDQMACKTSKIYYLILKECVSRRLSRKESHILHGRRSIAERTR